VGETGEAGETGDVLIDAALRGLDEAPPEDLDAQIEAGRRVHQTLQARLSDLGGE
jgi:DNA polymerase-3 subunit gamma/tau